MNVVENIRIEICCFCHNLIRPLVLLSNDKGLLMSIHLKSTPFSNTSQSLILVRLIFLCPTFLLTLSIQYNKFETIGEIENESGS
jgi:hypothetical protein